jgi:hypothetical protein
VFKFNFDFNSLTYLGLLAIFAAGALNDRLRRVPYKRGWR